MRPVVREKRAEVPVPVVPTGDGKAVHVVGSLWDAM